MFSSVLKYNVNILLEHTKVLQKSCSSLKMRWSLCSSGMWIWILAHCRGKICASPQDLKALWRIAGRIAEDRCRCPNGQSVHRLPQASPARRQGPQKLRQLCSWSQPRAWEFKRHLKQLQLLQFFASWAIQKVTVYAGNIHALLLTLGITRCYCIVALFSSTNPKLHICNTSFIFRLITA